MSHGQAVGRCKVTRRAEVATRAGTAISLRRMVAVVAFARSLPAMAAVRWVSNAMTARTSQAALAVNLPEGRWARAELFRSAWTCHDGAAAVGLVVADGVHVGRVGGGEEGMEAPGVEQGALPVVVGIQVGDGGSPGARGPVR